MDNREQSGFYTLKGYQLQQNGPVTEAMEDYLEMICRRAKKDGVVRISALARELHVRPSSSSKMVAQLRELGYVQFEKYGLIRPTAAGWALGDYLLERHRTLQTFFCLVNGTSDELKLVEQLEHYIDRRTLENLRALLPLLRHWRASPSPKETWQETEQGEVTQQGATAQAPQPPETT